MPTAVAMTYDSLVENIQSYLERTDQATIDKIPLFIMLAEQVIASEIKFLGNLNVANSTFVAGANNITVAGERQPVLLRKYEYLREYWPDDTQTDVPKFYCDYNYDNWLVAPTPDSNYSFEVLYYERVQPLDSTNQTNWFTIYAPQALLYGSLLQAMPFLKNDERLPMWQAQYQAIMNTLKTENTQRIGDRQATVLDT
jgi:hypothetical protein